MVNLLKPRKLTLIHVFFCLNNYFKRFQTLSKNGYFHGSRQDICAGIRISQVELILDNEMFETEDGF